MSPTKRLSRWSAAAARQAALATFAALLAAVPMAAASGGPEPGAQGSPPPQIDSYQPFPAAWGQPITIYGSHLVPWQDPSTTAQTQPALSNSGFKKAIELLQPKNTLETGPSQESQPAAPASEGSQPVLKVGSQGKKAHYVIPASDIESWTSTEIHIKKLPGSYAGAYWIAVYQNGKRVSNRNRTLFFFETAPDITHTLVELNPCDSEDDDGVPVLTVNYPPVQQPSQPSAWVLTYTPSVIGAEDEVEIAGFFGPQTNRRLYFGVANKPLGRIDPASIKEWSNSKIRVESGLFPTGVYWIAVFDVSNGLELISNLNWSLQVTEDPPPPPSGNSQNQIIKSLGNLPLQNLGGSSSEPGGKSGLQRLPMAPGTGGSVEPLSPQRRMQQAPRMKILRPSTETGRSQSSAAERKVLKVKKPRQPASRTTTAPIAPVPGGAPDRTLQPAEEQPSVQQLRTR